MKHFGTCILVFLLFFIAAAAVLQIDRHCCQVTGFGGDIAVSAELIVEKMGSFG